MTKQKQPQTSPDRSLKKALRFLSILFISLSMQQIVQTPIFAESINNYANPIQRSGTNPTYFEDVLAPQGEWTSTSTQAIEGRQAYYTVPQIESCNKTVVNSINISLFAEGDPDPYSYDLTGASATVFDSSTTSVKTVSQVHQGSRLDGAFALSIDPNEEQEITRGVTNPAFTTTQSPMPGEISFDIDTTNLSINEYNSLVIRVKHDLRDLPGFITSITTTRPKVLASYDSSACNTPTSTISTPKTGGYDGIGKILMGVASGTFLVVLLVFIRKTKFKKS